MPWALAASAEEPSRVAEAKTAEETAASTPVKKRFIMEAPIVVRRMVRMKQV
jgi:hypothetical protein